MRRPRAATARPERGEREPGAVSLQHLDPREQVVAERHRLRALQMRVARHRRGGVLFGAREGRVREGDEHCVRFRARIRDVEAERCRDLVVPRAAGVDLPPDVTELALDRRVHVLVVLGDLLDRGEPLGHVGELRVIEDPGRMEAPRVQERRLQVVRKQLRVVCVQEVPHLGRELGADAARPHRHSSHPSFSSIARASATSFHLTFSCPIRSAAVNAVALRSIDSRSGS